MVSRQASSIMTATCGLLTWHKDCSQAGASLGAETCPSHGKRGTFKKEMLGKGIYFKRKNSNEVFKKRITKALDDNITKPLNVTLNWESENKKPPNKNESGI